MTLSPSGPRTVVVIGDVINDVLVGADRDWQAQDPPAHSGAPAANRLVEVS